MIEIGIVLLVVGVVMIIAAAVVAQVPAVVSQLGWLFVLVGVILIVIAALFVGADSAIDALVGGGVAMATPASMRHFHTAGDDERARPVAGSLKDRQPVLVAFVLGAVPLILAAVTALADIFAGIPDWLVPTLTVVGTLTTGLATMWARMQVTPTALPRLDDETPLVPMTENEAV